MFENKIFYSNFERKIFKIFNNIQFIEIFKIKISQNFEQNFQKILTKIKKNLIHFYGNYGKFKERWRKCNGKKLFQVNYKKILEMRGLQEI